MPTIDEFVKSYSQAMADGTAAVLIGAGLSVPAGLVNWKELMRSIAREVDLDVDRETDLVALAQYHLNQRGGRQRINQTLVTEFAGRARLTQNHRILARIPIGTYWTTNYDCLIEESLRAADRNPDVKITISNLSTTRPRRDALVYKMHGDVSNPDEAVVTKDDYESYNSSPRGELFSTALRGDLVAKTFLFLGFSFNDPNIDYILSRIRVLLGRNRREHYYLMRSVQREDFKNPADYRYAKVQQDHRIRDLGRYGIMAVALQSFDQYPKTLERLEQAYRQRTVFISGSAASYAPWTDSVAQEFLTLLSRNLVERGRNVSTGFGVGVGEHVINGVLIGLEREGALRLDDRLTLRPFPFNIKDKNKRDERWQAYREEMISNAGVIIFVFGNKTDSDGRLIAADGMMKELEIARHRGLLVVPVASTGGVAKDIHDRVGHQLDRYLPAVKGIKTAFAHLKKSGRPAEIVDRIMMFLNVAGAFKH